MGTRSLWLISRFLRPASKTQNDVGEATPGATLRKEGLPLVPQPGCVRDSALDRPRSPWGLLVLCHAGQKHRLRCGGPCRGPKTSAEKRPGPARTQHFPPEVPAPHRHSAFPAAGPVSLSHWTGRLSGPGRGGYQGTAEEGTGLGQSWGRGLQDQGTAWEWSTGPTHSLGGTGPGHSWGEALAELGAQGLSPEASCSCCLELART